MRGFYLIFLIMILASANVKADTESGDTIRKVSLDSVVVKSSGSIIKTQAGSVHMAMDVVNSMPKIFGNSDPLHYSQMIPGISTNGEYDAGIRVLGCENGHNYVSINDTPVYGANHLLGLFSVFNASHFREMKIQKAVSKGEHANRLGAVIDMQTDETIPDSIKGNLDVGLISSQGTLAIPIGKKSCLTVSGRGSYMNLLYSPFLKNDDQDIRYSFYDTNLSFITKPDTRNTIKIDTYLGGDKMKLSFDNDMDNIHSLWGNQMISAQWTNERDKLTISNHAYYTRYYCNGEIDADRVHADLPSSLSELGYKFNMDFSRLSLGCDLSAYHIVPQNPDVTVSSTTYTSEKNVYDTREFSVHGDYTINLTSPLSVLVGLKTSLYGVGDKNYLRCSPALKIVYDSHKLWNVMLGYSLRHQFVHQTGMSSINTPLEYWVTSGTDNIPSQSCHGVIADFNIKMPDNSYALNFETYYKWLTNQLVYNATIYSFLTMSNDVSSLYYIGSGRNYGVNVTLSKNNGWLRGWLGYSWSKAMRTYNDGNLQGTFPSSHDRTHEVNLVLSATINNRFSIGVTGVYATGNPFTAPKSFMILQDRLIPQFNEHNSNRLGSYFRLDFSLDYHFKKTSRFEHSINLSVYNLTAHKNDLFYYMCMYNDIYEYKPLQFALRVMPSISYNIKF